MILRENVPLASLTTFRVGGTARAVIECRSVQDVEEALDYARTMQLPYTVLGEGSNVLASDAGYDGLIVLMRDERMEIEEEEDAVRITLGAGYSWDRLVMHAAQQSLWGVENLAGIPGTVGAAPVQNIGAYGVEVEASIASVSVVDSRTRARYELARSECSFEYRDSRFKQDRALVITGVTFELARAGVPRTDYADVARYEETHGPLTTPSMIGDAVRQIRGRKFPDLAVCGTAGSFFKNPVVSADAYAALLLKYPELPGFAVARGVKIPLAFVLDRVLGLRGHREGSVRLFEAQPLVLVADEGATASSIDAFAHDIARRVHDVIGVSIEREVQSLPRE